MIGMLWLDADPKRSLEEKVGLAVERYEKKHGHKPTTCYVNPLTFGTEKSSLRASLEVGEVTVRPLSTILPNHFWLVIDDSGGEE